MTRLDELLDNAIGPVVPALGVADVERAAARRRRRRLGVRATIAVALAALVAGVVWVGSSGETSVTTSVADRGVFPGHTGDVLVFDDGYDGITAVDLDHRLAVRRRMHGASAGARGSDPVRVEGALVVRDEFGKALAVPLDGSEPRPLGQTVLAFAATEHGRVWLIDYAGGAVGAGTPTVRQVDVRGHVFIDERGPDPATGPPVIAIPGGLGFQTRTGLALWDAATGSITGRLGTGGVFPADIHSRTLAWCEGGCMDLHLSTIGGGGRVVHAPKGTNGFAGYEGRFSPDGRWFVAPAGVPGAPGTTHTRFVLIDVRRGVVRALGPSIGADTLAVGWSPDSQRLYFSTDSYRKSRTTIGEHVVATRKTRVLALPFGGALGFFALSHERAAWLLTGRIGDPGACRAAATYTSGRTTSCAFRFSVHGA